MKVKPPRSIIAAARRTFKDMNKLAAEYIHDGTLGPLYGRLRDAARSARTFTESSHTLPSDTELVPEEYLQIVAELRGLHSTGLYSEEELVDFYNLPPEYVKLILEGDQ